MKPRVLFLVGPTAAGKSSLALKLAQKINAEIISCDSMQVYCGMDVLTSKPSKQERKKVRHHLIDIVPPSKNFDVSRYRRRALKAIKEVHGRGRLPLFVGGTGLYVSMVIDGIFEKKTENAAVRRRLYSLAGKRGSACLHDRLKKADPRAAAKIHPHDTRRIVRALEVFQTTGRTISELQAERTGLGGSYDVRIFGLDVPRRALYKKIDARVERMFRAGLVREVRRLLAGRLSRTARYAIGIPEVKTYSEGALSLAEARELMKKNTRKYARRQLTWFRRDKRIQWIHNASDILQSLKG